MLYLLTKNNGDWGLGIGDWAIPNPQSPIPNARFYLVISNNNIINC